jgi:hypothetical protein
LLGLLTLALPPEPIIMGFPAPPLLALPTALAMNEDRDRPTRGKGISDCDLRICGGAEGIKKNNLNKKQNI